MLDRLELTDARIAAMSRGLREVAELPDPVGRVLDRRERPNGLRLHKVATPLGVILIIYESRPNVTVDAAGLCLKSGNATILRGGKEALHSNRILARTMVEAARERSSGFPQEAIQVVPVTDREAVPILLSMTGLIDLCMPRGGEGLIRAVSESARIPVIKHHRGLCHVYVDRDADPQRAVSHTPQRQDAASRCVQRHGDPADRPGPGPGIDRPDRWSPGGEGGGDPRRRLAAGRS